MYFFYNTLNRSLFNHVNADSGFKGLSMGCAMGEIWMHASRSVDRFVENKSIHTRDPFSTSCVCAPTRFGLPHVKALVVWLTVHCNYVMGPIAQSRGCAGDYCTEKSHRLSRGIISQNYSPLDASIFFCQMFR